MAVILSNQNGVFKPDPDHQVAIAPGSRTMALIGVQALGSPDLLIEIEALVVIDRDRCH